jgi:addiction module HigA family antidote
LIIRSKEAGLLRRYAPRNDEKKRCNTGKIIAAKGVNMVYAAKRGKNRCPTHPGALLRDDIIPATGRTKAEIAGLLGISRQHLYDILQERKPVSATIAVRLGKLFGDGAGIWTRMQAAYDTWHAERTEDVSRIPTIKAKAA